MHTIQLESDIQADTGYLECFRGVNLRRTEIVVLTFIGQQLAGSNFAYSPAYFLQQAGASVAVSFNVRRLMHAPPTTFLLTLIFQVGLGGTAIAFAGTLCSWILLSYFGRRSVYFVGMLGCCTVLLVVGITSAAAPDSTAALWVQVTFMLLWQAVYSTTVGPMCYAITSETSAIRLRPQSVVLARNSYNLVYIIAMTINPYMINPTEWNLEGKTGFVWAATAGMMATWAYFRLPETKVWTAPSCCKLALEKLKDEMTDSTKHSTAPTKNSICCSQRRSARESSQRPKWTLTPKGTRCLNAVVNDNGQRLRIHAHLGRSQLVPTADASKIQIRAANLLLMIGKRLSRA